MNQTYCDNYPHYNYITELEYSKPGFLMDSDHGTCFKVVMFDYPEYNNNGYYYAKQEFGEA